MALLDEATLAAKEALHAHGIQRHALPLRLPLNARQFAGGSETSATCPDFCPVCIITHCRLDTRLTRLSVGLSLVHIALCRLG